MPSSIPPPEHRVVSGRARRRATAPHRVTIREVAQASYTSIATVSVALSGGPGVAPETRAHILEVADRLGWRPDRYASSLRRHESGLVGFVCQVDQVFQTGLVDSLYLAAQRHGLELVLAGATRHHDERACVDETLRERCQAMVLSGSELTEEDIAELATRLPTVILGRLMNVPGADVVVSDDKMGMHQVIEHLVSLGHRDILHVDGGGPGYPLAKSRVDGYLAAMAEFGLDSHAQVVPGGNTLTEGFLAARRLLARTSLPTAVVCFNDMAAAAFARELTHAGLRVPEDMSVIGFDDCLIASDPSTALTTVIQDPDGLAEAAFTRLETRLSGSLQSPYPGSLTVIPTELVVRRTTGPAPRR